MTARALNLHWTFPDGAIRPVGRVALIGGAGIQQFTYDADWLARGFAIGADLPLEPGAQTPPGGRSTFATLDDAGPDAWGRMIISRGRPLAEVSSSLGMLAAAADEPRQGALRLSEDGESFIASGHPGSVGEVTALMADVEAFAHGTADRTAMRRLLAGSTSQGGARPKIALRNDTDPEAGSRAGSLVIAKLPSELDTYDVEACEAVALRIAQDAGLRVPARRLLRLDSARSVLLIDRFDRTQRGRLGYQSMRTAALLGEFEGYSYAVGAETARFIAGDDAVRAVVGAAVLAICTHSIDDHARNFGFLHDGATWSAAPLFDVVPYPQEQEGTPLSPEAPGRSLEQLLDMDWGLRRSEVLALTTRVARVARSAWDRAPEEFGLDPEIAEACRALIESTCDFDTVLDGTRPRFGS